MPSRFGFWILGLTSLATLGLGAWTMGREISPALGGGNTPLTRILAMTEGNVSAGLTISSQRASLIDCEVAMRSTASLEARYLSQADMARIPPICQEMAQDVLAHSPTNGLAWLVSGAAAAQAGDMARYETGYARSVLAGPNEGWLVALRLQQAERHPIPANSTASAYEIQDLASAAGNPDSAPAIASRFLADPDFRDRMTTILETMPADSQRAFLWSVDSALSAAGR